MINSEKKPKISVIIAAYNAEQYIGRCLRSLIKQTIQHTEYEIIVIDDGSNDNTPYALDLFVDPKSSNVKVITNNVNLGLPASLNKGVKVARGDYIVRVDSDDFVNVNFLNFLSYYLDTNSYSDAVACDYLLIDDMENEISRLNAMKEPIACGIMFRKEKVFATGLYDEEFLCHEDKDFRIRFEKKFAISHLEIPLYRYRRHGKNITNNKKLMETHYQNLISKHGQP